MVSAAGGAIGTQLGRSDVVAAADYDRDGFLDLFVTNGADPTSPFVADGPHQLFRNQGNSNYWLEIDLEGVTSNRDGIGSKLSWQQAVSSRYGSKQVVCTVLPKTISGSISD